MNKKTIAGRWLAGAVGVLLGVTTLTGTGAAQSGKGGGTRRTSSAGGEGTVMATPVMGWNSWFQYGCAVSDSAVRAAADAMVTTGLKSAGYVYLNVDDCWQGTRDASGVMQGSARFPDMKALGAYIHSKGLKFGLYSSPGPKTCAGREGSYGHEEQDAKTYAKWGVDFLRYDLCGTIPNKGDAHAAFKKMHAALVTTGRPIVYSICYYGFGEMWQWAAQAGANLWCSAVGEGGYHAVIETARAVDSLASYDKPGHWNDPGLLQVGTQDIFYLEEIRSHLTAWAMLGAPLILQDSLESLADTLKEVLANPEVIAVDQDRIGKPGRYVPPDTGAFKPDEDEQQPATKPESKPQFGGVDIWKRPLADGTMAVAIFNKNDSTGTVTLPFGDFGMYGKTVVRDLWGRRVLVTAMGRYTVNVPPHDVMLLKLSNK